MDLKGLAGQFASVYGHDPDAAVRAPGRVNLIGEHTDYNGGFVLPIAIERHTVALFVPQRDRRVRLASLQAPDAPAEIDLDGPIAPGQPRWANYCRGVAAGLIERGVRLAGADVLLASDVPIGGGLSSSASLEVATAMALLAVAGATAAVPDADLARLCQRAENVYAAAPCGIMDQSAVVMARAGRALLLDCRDGTTRHVPFDDPSVVLLVADTQVKHSIGDGGYPLRRRQCEKAAERMGVAFLREMDREGLERAARAGALAGDELKRARHVVTEIERTLDAARALEARDYVRFGRRMFESHASLRDDFEVSCEELDAIVERARACEGVFGARMTGGGFGGCAIVLVRADRAEATAAALADDFAARFGRRCPVFATGAAPGAGAMALPAR